MTTSQYPQPTPIAETANTPLPPPQEPGSVEQATPSERYVVTICLSLETRRELDLIRQQSAPVTARGFKHSTRISKEEATRRFSDLLHSIYKPLADAFDNLPK